jgi:serine/threonine protein kinase
VSPELERLFLETAELEPEARGRYLDEHCSNPEMRARVERLLLFDGASEEFLKSPLQRFAGKVSTEAAKRMVSSPAAPVPETAEPALSFQPGALIGDYEVVALLGAGGMGRVYKVRNLISDRWEAAKVLVPDLQGQAEMADRFAREIKLHASLAHPNIAKLHTAFRFKDCLVMVMELLEGMALKERLRQSPIPAEEGVSYMCQVLEALSYAHARGVVHRDIKPANIMLTPGGTAKLMDFGVARAPSRLRLTNPGTAVGRWRIWLRNSCGARSRRTPDPTSTRQE